MTMTTTATATATATVRSPKIAASVDAIIAHLTPGEFLDLVAHGIESDTYAAMAKTGDRFWADAVLERIGEHLRAVVIGRDLSAAGM